MHGVDHCRHKLKLTADPPENSTFMLFDPRTVLEHGQSHARHQKQRRNAKSEYVMRKVNCD